MARIIAYWPTLRPHIYRNYYMRHVQFVKRHPSWSVRTPFIPDEDGRFVRAGNQNHSSLAFAISYMFSAYLLDYQHHLLLP